MTSVLGFADHWPPAKFHPKIWVFLGIFCAPKFWDSSKWGKFQLPRQSPHLFHLSSDLNLTDSRNNFERSTSQCQPSEFAKKHPLNKAGYFLGVLSVAFGVALGPEKFFHDKTSNKKVLFLNVENCGHQRTGDHSFFLEAGIWTWTHGIQMVIGLLGSWDHHRSPCVCL